MIGSNTEKVVRLAQCPVFSVPCKVELGKLKKILFPSNGSLSNKSVEVAINFQELLGGSLELLWVHTPHVIENEDSMHEKLKHEIEVFSLDRYQTYIRKSISVEEGILSFAEETQADLIFMATHGHQGLKHLFEGSFTENIVNHSKRPVLTQKIY